MTALLAEAFARLEQLPEPEQDHLAVMILAEVNAADDGWDKRFAATLPELDKLAEEAREAHRRGATLPIDHDGL